MAAEIKRDAMMILFILLFVFVIYNKMNKIIIASLLISAAMAGFLEFKND
jgi:hypothetical protein